MTTKNTVSQTQPDRDPHANAKAKSGSKSFGLMHFAARLGIYLSVLCMAAGLGGLLSGAFAAEPEPVKKQTAETVEEAEGKTAEEKQEYQKAMRKNIAEIERNIAELRDQASKMASDSRKEFNKEITALEKQRDELKLKLDQVSKSSGRAWVRLRSGMDKAWTEMRAAFANAQKEFEAEEKASSSQSSESKKQKDSR